MMIVEESHHFSGGSTSIKDNGRDFNKQAFFSILKVTDNYLIVADEKYFYKINSEGEIVLKYEKSKIPNI